MWNILNPDSEISHILSKIIDVLLLSTLWLCLCLTVIGIGPAAVGLYYAVVKSVRRDRGSAYKEFIFAIRENWKTALPLGLLLTAFWAVVIVFDLPNLVAFFVLDDPPSPVWFCLSFLKILVVLSISIYLFPLISRYQIRAIPALCSALLLSIRNFFPTLAMCAIVAGSVYLAQFNPFFAVVIPAGVDLILSFFLEPILKGLLSDADLAKCDSVDKWYLE